MIYLKSALAGIITATFGAAIWIAYLFHAALKAAPVSSGPTSIGINVSLFSSTPCLAAFLMLFLLGASLPWVLRKRA